MLASLLSRRAKLHEELHNIEKHVYFSALAFGFPSKGAETFSHCVCTVTMSLRLNWACSDELLDSVEEIIEVSKTFNEKIRKCSDMTLLSCAYAGIGNVLKNIRRAIPLALGLLCISNPKLDMSSIMGENACHLNKVANSELDMS
ncbi:hypothetical protein JHK82_027201 [Glycine max]|nr:hypothetical protein JHK85_027828 [Glycine max]KAG5003189.1 hypothetical protein JHK86_027328 [Glycine max]KAG5126366.1 hypothetical protein JHK82_027201 [Glycine max]KAG5150966.1 hypothetical protein JHK84_027438 [Glycine max]